MSGWTFDKTAACGGIAFTVLAIASVAVVPEAPAIDADVRDVRQYLVENDGWLGVSVVLMALAVMAVGLSFGYIHRRLTDADSGTSLPSSFLIAGTVAVTTALAGALVQGVLVQHTTAIDDSALLVVHSAWHIIAFMGPPWGTAVALALVGTRTLQTGLFPRWLGAIAIASAAGGLAATMISLGTGDRAPVVLDLGSFLLTCTWATGIGIHALVKRAPDHHAERDSHEVQAISR